MVGESGLFTPADISYVQEAGVKAVSSVNLVASYFPEYSDNIFVSRKKSWNFLQGLFHLCKTFSCWGGCSPILLSSTNISSSPKIKKKYTKKKRNNFVIDYALHWNFFLRFMSA